MRVQQILSGAAEHPVFPSSSHGFWYVPNFFIFSNDSFNSEVLVLDSVCNLEWVKAAEINHRFWGSRGMFIEGQDTGCGFHQNNKSQSLLPEPAVLASPGNVSEMQSFRANSNYWIRNSWLGPGNLF